MALSCSQILYHSDAIVFITKKNTTTIYAKITNYYFLN